MATSSAMVVWGRLEGSAQWKFLMELEGIHIAGTLDLHCPVEPADQEGKFSDSAVPLQSQRFSINLLPSVFVLQENKGQN